MADFKQNYFQKRTKDRGPRSNNRISSPEVQVIANDGENLGILNTNEAISIAKKQDLDPRGFLRDSMFYFIVTCALALAIFFFEGLTLVISILFLVYYF